MLAFILARVEIYLKVKQITRLCWLIKHEIMCLYLLYKNADLQKPSFLILKLRIFNKLCGTKFHNYIPQKRKNACTQTTKHRKKGLCLRV